MPEIRKGKPVAWLVYCPDGHEFDFYTFGDEQDARDKASEFLDDSEDQTWNIYPLFLGLKPICVG
jgi:hypothetical protein